jgi:hypothetical protein
MSPALDHRQAATPHSDQKRDRELILSGLEWLVENAASASTPIFWA